MLSSGKAEYTPHFNEHRAEGHISDKAAADCNILTRCRYYLARNSQSRLTGTHNLPPWGTGFRVPYYEGPVGP